MLFRIGPRCEVYLLLGYCIMGYDHYFVFFSVYAFAVTCHVVFRIYVLLFIALHCLIACMATQLPVEAEVVRGMFT